MKPLDLIPDFVQTRLHAPPGLDQVSNPVPQVQAPSGSHHPAPGPLPGPPHPKGILQEDLGHRHHPVPRAEDDRSAPIQETQGNPSRTHPPLG